jgi:hypothetical protein
MPEPELLEVKRLSSDALINRGGSDVRQYGLEGEFGGGSNSLRTGPPRTRFTSDCTALLDAAFSKGFGPSDGRTGLHPVAPCRAPDKCNLSGAP